VKPSLWKRWNQALNRFDDFMDHHPIGRAVSVLAVILIVVCIALLSL
jgi:hypothetical protein